MVDEEEQEGAVDGDGTAVVMMMTSPLGARNSDRGRIRTPGAWAGCTVLMAL